MSAWVSGGRKTLVYCRKAASHIGKEDGNEQAQQVIRLGRFGVVGSGRIGRARDDGGATQAQSDVTQLSQPGTVGDEGINQLPPMAPGVVLVGLRTNVTAQVGRLGVQASDASLDATFADLGVLDIEPVFPTARRSLAAATGGVVDLSRIYRLRLSPAANVLRTVRELSANPAVVYAEPDYLAHVITTPNDPLYAGQWGLSQISAPAAWDVTTGSSDVVIAVTGSRRSRNNPLQWHNLIRSADTRSGNPQNDDRVLTQAKEVSNGQGSPGKSTAPGAK